MLKPGLDLFSQEVALKLSSALVRFTTLFGMERSSSTPLQRPDLNTKLNQLAPLSEGLYGGHYLEKCKFLLRRNVPCPPDLRTHLFSIIPYGPEALRTGGIHGSCQDLSADCVASCNAICSLKTEEKGTCPEGQENIKSFSTYLDQVSLTRYWASTACQTTWYSPRSLKES